MSTIIPHFPHEIIVNILSRLPVKPLFRFKCVCKSWLSLIINDPQFAKNHLRHAKQDATINRYRLFLSTKPFRSIDHDAYCYGENVETKELRYPDATIDYDDHLLIVIGSCNGLIAVNLDMDSRILVGNPTTGESRVLPDSDSSSSSNKAFYGFGYDPRIDDYKVVRGIRNDEDDSTSEVKMEVFNLKADTWRSIGGLQSNFPLDGLCISIDEFIHWLVRVGEYPDQKLGMVSFDMVEEKFLEMVEVPNDLIQEFGPNSLKIQRVGENLCVCTGIYEDRQEGWIMKREERRDVSWRKWYSFNSRPLPHCYQWREVLWVAENGNVVLDLDGKELVLYDPKRQCSLESINWDGFQTITYMETLVSPNFT